MKTWTKKYETSIKFHQFYSRDIFISMLQNCSVIPTLTSKTCILIYFLILISTHSCVRFSPSIIIAFFTIIISLAIWNKNTNSISEELPTTSPTKNYKLFTWFWNLFTIFTKYPPLCTICTSYTALKLYMSNSL